MTRDMRTRRWLSFVASVAVAVSVWAACSNGVPLGPVDLSSVPAPSPNVALITPVTLKVSAPTPQSPVNDQAVSAFPISLLSGPSTGLYVDVPLQYRFEVLDSAGTLVQDSGVINALSFAVTAFLSPHTTYGWRVRAEAQGNAGPWSTVALFVTPTPAGPSVSCPATQVAVSSNSTAVAVTYPTPTVTAGLPPITMVCTPPSGGLFSVGTTRVNCTATDSLQRVSACTFDVIVQPPALSFGIDIQPILKADCASCHEASPPSGGFSTATYQTVMAAVQPYNPNSALVLATQFPNDMYVYLTGDPALKSSRILQWVMTGALP